jgi:hypothetical protein
MSAANVTCPLAFIFLIHFLAGIEKFFFFVAWSHRDIKEKIHTPILYVVHVPAGNLKKGAN